MGGSSVSVSQQDLRGVAHAFQAPRHDGITPLKNAKLESECYGAFLMTLSTGLSRTLRDGEDGRQGLFAIAI
jgi:hypothetical protein